MRRLPSLSALFVVAITPLWAASKLEPPELDRYLRWGPLRVRPGVELSNLGYDDNIFFDPESEQVSDYTATISPQLEGLVLLGHRAFVTFRERLEYTAYVENTDQNYLNQRGQARVTVPLQRFGLFTDLKFDRVQERPADREDIRPERDEDVIALGVIVQPGWRTEIEIGGYLGRWRYTDADFDPSSGGLSIGDALDHDEEGRFVRSTYQLVGRTALTLDLEQRDYEFVNQALARDSVERGVRPGVRFGAGGSLAGTLKIGWVWVDPLDLPLATLSEPVVEAELAWRPVSSTTITIDGDRRAGFALQEGSQFYLEGRYGLRVVRYWNRILGGEIGGEAGRLSFPDGSPRRDSIRRYDAGVRLRLSENTLGRRVEYSLKLGRYERDSSDDFLDQTQNTVSFGAVVGY